MTKKEERIQQVRRQKRILFFIIVGIILFVGITLTVILGKKEKVKPKEEVTKEAPDKKAEEEQLLNINVDFDKLHSSNAILMDVKTGRVLKEKNSGEKIYPASLTKIMTVLIGAEHKKVLDKMVKIPSEIQGALIENHASVAGFDMGEEVRGEDLLYGAILSSGADCCMTIAREIAGSEEKFLELMNQKAVELGLKNTHFADVSGFHHDENYSTVVDLAKLLRASLQNKEFYQVFTTDVYTTTKTKEHPEGIKLESTLYKNLETLNVTGGQILGGKTGYTESAGLCLATLAKINGKEYILVTAKADGNLFTEGFHVTDAVNIYEQIGKQ